MRNPFVALVRPLVALLFFGVAISGCGEAAPATPSGESETAAAPGGPASVPAEGPAAPGEGTSEPAGAPTGASSPMAAPADPATEAAVPATICERARACCDAFVAAIPSARRPLEERACTEMDRVLGTAGDGSDEACEAAIGGWRQSLQLTGIEVPPDCLE